VVAFGPSLTCQHRRYMENLSPRAIDSSGDASRGQEGSPLFQGHHQRKASSSWSNSTCGSNPDVSCARICRSISLRDQIGVSLSERPKPSASLPFFDDQFCLLPVDASWSHQPSGIDTEASLTQIRKSYEKRERHIVPKGTSNKRLVLLATNIFSLSGQTRRDVSKGIFNRKVRQEAPKTPKG